MVANYVFKNPRCVSAGLHVAGQEGVRAGNRGQQELSISCSVYCFQIPLKQGAPQPCSAICSDETALYLCHFNFFLVLLT